MGDFVKLTLELLLGFMHKMTILVAFCGILWNLSGVLTFQVGDCVFAIHGYMFWVSLLYAILGTYFAHAVSGKPIPLHYAQQQYEANFRFSMMRVRENSESIAFYGGETKGSGCAYATLASLASVIRRPGLFRRHMEAARAVSNGVRKVRGEAGQFQTAVLQVRLPDGRTLMRDCSLVLKSGQRLLVTGAYSCGKSTFLRTVSGIWPFGNGEADDWSRILSLGEQQRIAFARALRLLRAGYSLMRPRWPLTSSASGNGGRAWRIPPRVRTSRHAGPANTAVALRLGVSRSWHATQYRTRRTGKHTCGQGGDTRHGVRGIIVLIYRKRQPCPH